jgi:threonine dehydrogenase-like Zn-dependent dehydrogenase
MECAERLGMPVGVGGGYDVVFDAAGTESSLAAAIAAVRPAGTVVMPALYWTDVPFPGLSLGTREVRLVPAFLYGSHGGVREMDLAADLDDQFQGVTVRVC